MPWFARRSAPAPEHLPLGVPALDGGGWPDPAQVGRPSFATATYAELGNRRAYEPEAAAAADRLVAAALPRLDTGVSDEDAPYLRKTYWTAARIGAGLGLVEHDLPTPERSVDRAVAGALLQARAGLTDMPPDRARAAAWFLLAGYHVGRGGPDVVPQLLEAIGQPAR